MIRRYSPLPDEYLSFLRKVAHCQNAAGTAWFLCETDFHGLTDAAFRWDEWEQIGLEAARADTDAKWAEKIRAFWDHHLPFQLSVKNGYAFAALSLAPATYGTVVVGFEPGFEETETVAESLAEWLAALATAARDGSAVGPLCDFV